MESARLATNSPEASAQLEEAEGGRPREQRAEDDLGPVAEGAIEAVNHVSEGSAESGRWARWRERRVEKKERMLARQLKKQRDHEMTPLCSNCLRSIGRPLARSNSFQRPVSAASCKTCCLLRARPEDFGSRSSSSSSPSTSASAASSAPRVPIQTLQLGIFLLPEAVTVLQEQCKWVLRDAPPEKTRYCSWP
uniref:Uncharacterized protein n=1 Tax=Alexandrium monilatum TaxID=311494 RepID=A0A7S4Q9E3_9DINO